MEDKLTITLDAMQSEFLAGILGMIVSSDSEPGVRLMAKEIWYVLIDAAVLDGKIDISDLPPPRED